MKDGTELFFTGGARHLSKAPPLEGAELEAVYAAADVLMGVLAITDSRGVCYTFTDDDGQPWSIQLVMADVRARGGRK